jgi:hypothetical protein
VALEKPENCQQLCFFCFIANTPVLYQSSSMNCNNSVTRVAEKLRVPTYYAFKGHIASS